MAHTVYTGKGMTLTVEAMVQNVLRSVSIEEKARAAAENFDKTLATSAAYEYMIDPMGAKGDQHSTLTFTEIDSTVGFAENQAHKLTLGGAGVAAAFAVGSTSNDTKWDHAGVRLTRRVTTIPHDALATVECTYEALTAGTWSDVP